MDAVQMAAPAEQAGAGTASERHWSEVCEREAAARVRRGSARRSDGPAACTLR